MFHPVEAVHWLQMISNRPGSRSLDETIFWSLYEQNGQRLTAAPASLSSRGPTELLVVVTTYHRAASCAQVLESLRRAIDRAGSPSTALLVFHDRDPNDAADAAAYEATHALARDLFGTNLAWLETRQHLGKAEYWRTFQTSFLAARQLQPRYALYLQDDLQFSDSLLVDTLQLFDATKADPLRRVLYLFSSQEDEPNGRWIRFRRKPAGAGLLLTQWFDLQAFFADRAFFELLAYRMIPIHPNRWRRKRSLSSGVGRQLTIRLRRHAHVYQAFPPLVFHGAEPSEMNPAVRAHQPLDNRTLRQDPGSDVSSPRDRER